MLQSLYEYALRHNLTIPDGYVRKTVKAYIALSSRNKTYVEITSGDNEALPCPDIGSLANGTEKSNVLVEKRSVVLPEKPTVKSRFFLDTLKSLGESDEKIKVCTDVLENEELRQIIREKLDTNKINDSDRISFSVDYDPIIQFESVLPWWKEFRKQFQSNDDGKLVPCLITGEKITPVATTPKIKGLFSVGGHSSGDALICFDKDAFQSYGLKQAANAPVSESAMNAVKAALDDLLLNAPDLVGIKFVHWYDFDRAMQDDPIITDIFGNDLDRIERDTRLRADHLIQNIETRESVASPDANYYILLLTGANGRIMVRRYERGRYDRLLKNIELWNRDLELIAPTGTENLTKPKLTGLLIRLLKYQKKETKVFDRIKDELSGIGMTIVMAILNGSQMPDMVATRSLAYIRSKIFTSDDSETKGGASNELDCLAYQWLKVWLLRKNRTNHPESEELLMNEYNMAHHEAAYHCGGMMAVYVAIQNAGYRDVNVNVVQRYYASAIQTPALVLGRLSQLSVHHMERIEYKSVADLYKQQLEKLSVAIGDTIPQTLNLEKQAYFALGYYQMSAKLRSEMRERIHNAKSRTNESETEE